MVDDRDGQRHQRWLRYLKCAMAIASLAVLGSCVAQIDAVGGALDSNRQMAGIFFFHLFLIVPCLVGIYIYLQVKLERYFANNTHD